MAKSRQINKMRLRWDKNDGKWKVIAPDKRVLEEFNHDMDAVVFMEETYDFLTERGRQQAIKAAAAVKQAAVPYKQRIFITFSGNSGAFVNSDEEAAWYLARPESWVEVTQEQYDRIIPDAMSYPDNGFMSE